MKKKKKRKTNKQKTKKLKNVTHKIQMSVLSRSVTAIAILPTSTTVKFVFVCRNKSL